VPLPWSNSTRDGADVADVRITIREVRTWQAFRQCIHNQTPRAFEGELSVPRKLGHSFRSTGPACVVVRQVQAGSLDTFCLSLIGLGDSPAVYFSMAESWTWVPRNLVPISMQWSPPGVFSDNSY